MSVAVQERPASHRSGNGGVPARRAVIRWGWRLLRREWRQQLLILALITVAVAATVVSGTVATTTPATASATFGTASDLAAFSSGGPHVRAQIAALAHRFGPVDVIENQTISIPGSVQTYDLRAQNPHGRFGQPMLALVSGHYPAAPDQAAVTAGLASQLGLTIGDTWHAGGRTWRVVGTVTNPQDLLDAFALVQPGQLTAPTQTTVLFDAPHIGRASIGPAVQARQSASAANVINPATISVAAATLGMLLIALVSVGGFTVLAQRRLRSIGMLGAQGATDANISLVVRANGVATGVAGALAGLVLGLVVWLAYRPRAEASAHHLIGAFQLPWLVIGFAMLLAVVAAYLAAARPARAIARLPLVAALAGRPPEPRPVRRWSWPAGLALLVVAFFLIGLASARAESGSGSSLHLFGPLVLGLVAMAAGVVLVSPSCLGALGRFTSRAPLVLRLALGDLARYRARSGAALGAVSLSVLIAAIICVASAARFGNVLDYAGPNMASNQLIVHLPTGGPGRQAGGATQPGGGQAGSRHRKVTKQSEPGPGQTITGKQLAAMSASAHRIAALLGAPDVIQLETTSGNLRRAAAGRVWNGPVYVATPRLLRAFGITAGQFSADADILTMRPGLDTLSRMQLIFGPAGQDFGPPGATQTTWPCPPASCLANPAIEEVGALPSGTSAPNTVITGHAVRQLGLTTSTAGWLLQTPAALTAAQVSAARQAAAAAGLTVETRNSIPSLGQIVDVATVFGILLALGILAMSVGLLRSETAGDLRTLTATGASAATRRAMSAVTAGALALSGAVVGTAGGYLAAIGFFRSSKLDALSSLSSIPVTNLLLILVGMPVAATLGGWLLAGREPRVIARQPLS
jgi:putative ABC transport system permease protein